MKIPSHHLLDFQILHCNMEKYLDSNEKNLAVPISHHNFSLGNGEMPG